jgi:hypothetical protein
MNRPARPRRLETPVAATAASKSFVEHLACEVGDSAFAGDDEQVIDDSLPASDLVLGEDVRSASVEPLGQRISRGAAVARC